MLINTTGNVSLAYPNPGATLYIKQESKMITIELTQAQVDSITQQQSGTPPAPAHAPPSSPVSTDTIAYNFKSLYGSDLTADGKLFRKDISIATTTLGIEILIPELTRPTTFLAEELLTGDGSKRGSLTTELGLGNGKTLDNNPNIGASVIGGYEFPAGKARTVFLNLQQKGNRKLTARIHIMLVPKR